MRNILDHIKISKDDYEIDKLKVDDNEQQFDIINKLAS